MALTPEMVAAHDQLDAAANALIAASDAFDDGTVTTGYTLIVAGVKFDDDPDGDDQDTVSVGNSFCKRGQSPHLTRGMVECFLDEIRARGEE